MNAIKYNFPRTISMSTIQIRVNEIFSMARICKWTHAELSARLVAQICEPLNYKTPAGRRKHSVYLAGFAQGLIEARRADIWQHFVEFCYLVDGELYSTHKASTRKTTAEIYASGRGNILADCPSAHYWKGTNNVY